MFSAAGRVGTFHVETKVGLVAADIRLNSAG